MRSGLSTYTFTWAVGVPGKLPQNPMTAFDLIDLAHKHNLQCVQIADNLPLHSFSIEKLTELKVYAKSKNIIIESGSNHLTESNLEKYIEIAEFLESDILRFVIDGPDYKPSTDVVIGIIKNFSSILESKNILLAIENHDRFEARQFESIINQVASPNVGICLDTVNSMGAGEGVETIVNILAPYTFNFHLREYEVRRVWHKMGFIIEGKPLGQGMLPVKKILEKLTSKCKSAILEQWTPPAENIEDTVKKEMEWGLQSIKALKELVK